MRETPTFCCGSINLQEQRSIDPGLFVTDHTENFLLQDHHQSCSLSGHLTTRISHFIYQELEILIARSGRCNSGVGVKVFDGGRKCSSHTLQGIIFLIVNMFLNHGSASMK